MEIQHASGCAVHNAPAYEPGPCDCGAEGAEVTPAMIEAVRSLAGINIFSYSRSKRGKGWRREEPYIPRQEIVGFADSCQFIEASKACGRPTTVRSSYCLEHDTLCHEQTLEK